MPKWKVKHHLEFMRRKKWFFCLWIIRISCKIINQINVFSGSLSNVQDLTIHRAKPGSGADLKEPLYDFRKVINDQSRWTVLTILVIVVMNDHSDCWSSSWWDDHLQRNSQVITNHIDHHQLQYISRCKRIQNLSALMLFQKDAPTWTRFACRPRLDASIESQKYYSDRRVSHVPCNSRIPRVVGLPRWSWWAATCEEKFCLPRSFFCTKMSSPPSHMMLSPPLRHNFASNLSHFVTNLMQNLGASLAYIFVLWYYVIIVI